MNNFIAIDFETATSSPESAVSIGLVKYCDYSPVSSFYSLIRPPELYIWKSFTDIHGITVGDVEDAPTFKDVWESNIEEFIGGTTLAAHYAVFDMKVLRAVLKWYKIPKPKLQYFCTCNMARGIWPNLRSHALTALAKKFKIVYDAHNALEDAATCGKLVHIAAKQSGTGMDIEQLLKAAGIGMNYL